MKLKEFDLLPRSDDLAKTFTKPGTLIVIYEAPNFHHHANPTLVTGTFVPSFKYMISNII
jgi:hypothetical protein